MILLWRYAHLVIRLDTYYRWNCWWWLRHNERYHNCSSQTLFSEHGEIVVAKVVKDKLTKKSLGYGFVKFLREDDALAAIESKNGFLMGPKKFKVSLARPPSMEIRNCKLYITNLPKEFMEKDVIDLFNQVNFDWAIFIMECATSISIHWNIIPANDDFFYQYYSLEK